MAMKTKNTVMKMKTMVMTVGTTKEMTINLKLKRGI
jgi:hypothetical protein